MYTVLRERSVMMFRESQTIIYSVEERGTWPWRHNASVRVKGVYIKVVVKHVCSVATTWQFTCNFQTRAWLQTFRANNKISKWLCKCYIKKDCTEFFRYMSGRNSVHFDGFKWFVCGSLNYDVIIAILHSFLLNLTFWISSPSVYWLS